jgi:hypothetical protein
LSILGFASEHYSCSCRGPNNSFETPVNWKVKRYPRNRGWAAYVHARSTLGRTGEKQGRERWKMHGERERGGGLKWNEAHPHAAQLWGRYYVPFC